MTFVELFFDLVFVFAVTQVTVLTAHHLDVSGVLRSALLFWLIWWAWTQFTWTLNPADTAHRVIRFLTLAATGSAFIMAASVPRAFDDDPMWFAVPYVAIRAIGMAMQVRIDHERTDGAAGLAMQWVYISIAGLVAVLAGGLVDSPGRNWLWLAAIGLDLAAASVGGSSSVEWDIQPSHFSERHGLFVIIALGESLIVAGTAVAADERSTDLVLAAGASLVVACLLWWTYFDWLKEALEHGFSAAPAAAIGQIARDAFSFAHFPLICGIIGFAVAVEEILLHPERPAEGPVIASLAAGTALFVGASAFSYWRIVRRVLVPRLAVMAATIVVVALVAGNDPIWPLTVTALGLLAIVVLERSEGHGRERAPLVE